MHTLCQVRVVFDRCENMPEVVCVMVHTVALETASLEKIRQTWAKLHYLAIVVLERWYVCARASFACPVSSIYSA